MCVLNHQLRTTTRERLADLWEQEHAGKQLMMGSSLQRKVTAGETVRERMS